MQRFRPYFHYLRPVRLILIFGILLGVIGGATMSAGLPIMMEQVFPVIFKDRNTGLVAEAPGWLEAIGGNHLLLVACLMLPIVFLVSGVCNYFSKLFLSYVGLRVLEQIRVDVFNRLQRLSLGFHSKYKGGDLLNRVVTDTSLVRNVLTRVVSEMVTQPGALLGALGTLIYLSLKDSNVLFMLIALLSVPLCVFPIRLFGKKVAKKAKLMLGKQGDISSTVSENLASQQDVRAYMMEDDQVQKLQEDTAKFVKFNMGVFKYRYMISPSVEIVSAFGVGLAIYIGAKSGLTLQAFLPLLMALYGAYNPIKKIGNLSNIMKEGEAALDRVEQILHSDDEISDPDQPKEWTNVQGAVEIKKGEFGYGEETILTDLNIKIEAGQTVALVGESGAGKTTFVSLIPRFYELSKGDISVDGIPIHEMTKADLRSQIALVSQQPLLFSGTIAENILIGRKGASKEEVIEAAKKANAHHFIINMPDGYETVLGERGEGLSGGQRQRVAIARAFIKDASILILDEATSALDSKSESQIQESLNQLSENRTTFMIAHRFSTIRDAERILVFSKSPKGGKIIADGSHEEVYEKCQTYKNLYDKQS